MQSATQISAPLASAELSLAVIHKLELELIKECHSYCSANDIGYFLAYGTLLGAIRHGGFIPWDDDADLWLPRPDYERFVHSYEPSKPYYQLVRPNTPCYPFAWAKIVDRRTSYWNEAWNSPIEYGLSIDLFPLDADPGKKAFELYKKIVRFRRRSQVGQGTGYKDRLARLSARAIPGFANGAIADKVLSWGATANRDTYVNAHSPYTYDKEQMPKSWFGCGRRIHSFESAGGGSLCLMSQN